MSDPKILFALLSAAIVGLGLVSAAALYGWRGWLDLKRIELSGRRSDTPSPSPATRIEVADLKERVRKLEAIANGVELSPRKG